MHVHFAADYEGPLNIRADVIQKYEPRTCLTVKLKTTAYDDLSIHFPDAEAMQDFGRKIMDAAESLIETDKPGLVVMSSEHGAVLADNPF